MVVLPLLIIIGLILVPLFWGLRKVVASGTKLMLLGIHISLIGGIVAIDPNSELMGFEYLLVIIGFIVSLFGFKGNENN